MMEKKLMLWEHRGGASITAMGRRWGGNIGLPEEVMTALDLEEEQESV